MRKIKALIVTVIAYLCCITISAHDFEVDGIYYWIKSSSDLTVAVTYQGNYSDSYSNEYSGSVVIPEKVTYDSKEYSVTKIGFNAFNGCSGLTSVTIPNSVTIIETSAFYGCSGLTSVTIPNSVIIIGSSAFENCSGLTSVSIPNSVTSIGLSAFALCSGLTSVSIPNSVTSIGSNAFYGTGWYNNHSDGVLYLDNWLVDYKGTMPANTSINIKDGTKGIADSAFYGCSGLTSVTIPNSVTSIGSNAFSDCSGLTSITIPNSVTSIGGTTFKGCSCLTSVTIGNSVTCIGILAFKGCSCLTSVTIPNSVTCIGEEAFQGCSGLTSVAIGNSVTSIGRDAFYGCNSLYYVYNSSELDITKGATSHGYVAYYAKQVYDYEEIIDDYLFTTDEETGVHYLCGYVGNATELNLPKNYKGNNYCIADGVFRNCINVTSVTIPNSVTSIGSSAFEGCSGLTAVYISDLSAWCKIDFAYASSNPTYYAHHLYLNGEEIINLVIPDDVTSIGDWAFRDCSGLTSVTIPNSVTSISKFGFIGCTGLTAIKVDSENTKYDSRDNCNAIIETETNTLITGCKNTVIPNSVTIIGEYAFYDLTGMPTITIPKSVEKICYGALAYCN